MPKAGHLYRLNVRREEEINLERIRDILDEWSIEREIDNTNVLLRRNFSDLKIRDHYIYGLYQADIPVYIRSRDRNINIFPTLVEAEFVIKRNGKIIFFGKKGISTIFSGDINNALRNISIFQSVGGEICVKHDVPINVMESCINSPEIQSITYSAFEGHFDNFTTRQSIGGENLQHSTIFAELERRGRMYRLIVKLFTSQGMITVQITEEGLVLGYGNPTIDNLLEVIEFMERHGL